MPPSIQQTSSSISALGKKRSSERHAAPGIHASFQGTDELGFSRRNPRFDGPNPGEHIVCQLLGRVPVIPVDSGERLSAAALLPPLHQPIQDFLDPWPIHNVIFGVFFRERLTHCSGSL